MFQRRPGDDQDRGQEYRSFSFRRGNFTLMTPFKAFTVLCKVMLTYLIAGQGRPLLISPLLCCMWVSFSLQPGLLLCFRMGRLLATTAFVALIATIPLLVDRLTRREYPVPPLGSAVVMTGMYKHHHYYAFLSNAYSIAS